jgi:hypothetical protein
MATSNRPNRPLRTSQTSQTSQFHDPSHDVRDFSETANEQSLADFILNALEKSRDLAAADGEWQNEWFYFARMLKGHEAFEGLDARQAAIKLTKTVRGLKDDALAEIVRMWTAAKAPMEHPVDRAYRKAKANPRWPRDPLCLTYSLFKDMLIYLAEGTGRFFFSQADMAKRIGVSQRTISTYCQWAMDEGFLLLLKKGTRDLGASYYRVDPSKLQIRVVVNDDLKPLRESVDQAVERNARKWKQEA